MAALRGMVAEALSNVSDEAGLMRELRLFRGALWCASPGRKRWLWLLKRAIAAAQPSGGDADCRRA